MYLSLIHVNTGTAPDRPHPGRDWLRDPYRVHQRLWMAFPNQRRKTDDPYFLQPWEDEPSGQAPKRPRRDEGFLFRVEREGRPRIIVQSTAAPDWEYAFQNAPHLVTGWDVRSVDPQPREGAAYRFRLLANVVKRKSMEDPAGRTRTTKSGLTIMRRKRAEVPVHPDPPPTPLPAGYDDRQRALMERWRPWRDWLDSLGTRHGFRLLNDPPLAMEPVHAFVRPAGETHGGLRGNDPKGWRFNAGAFEGALVCEDAKAMRAAIANGVGPGKAFGFGLLSIAPRTWG